MTFSDLDGGSMQLRIIRTCLTTALLLLCAGGALAAEEESKPKAATPKAAAPKAAPGKSTKSGIPESAPRTKGKLKPVDINSAGKKDMAFMLGIPESLAAKIIAGRPYRTKAHLFTRQIVSADVYARIKDKVIAKQ